MSFNKKYIFFIIFVFLLGISLRFYNLTNFSFWYDEAVAALQASHINQIDFLRSNTPPLFIYFLNLWNNFSKSDLWLRMSSVFFSSISIIIFFIVGKLLFSKKTALIGSFFLAISPFHIYYAQEVSKYAILGFLCLSSSYFFIKFCKSKKTVFLIGFVIFSLLSIFCHYLALFFWLAQLCFYLFWENRIVGRTNTKWWISNSVVFLISAPWLLITYFSLKGLEKKFIEYGINFWGPKISFENLFMTFKNFTVGYNSTPEIFLLATIIFFVLLVKGIYKYKNKNLFYCLICLFFPILSVFFISFFYKKIYIDRFFIPSSFFYLLIVSRGVCLLKKKTFYLSILFISILTLFPLENYYDGFLISSPKSHTWIQAKKDHRLISKYVAKRYKEGDKVFHYCLNTLFPYIYYSDKVNKGLIPLEDKNLRLNLSTNGGLKVARFDFNLIPQDEGFLEEFFNGKRFWLIVSYWVYSDIKSDSKYSIFRKRLSEKYRLVKCKKFDKILLLLYHRI